ncbi:MAG: flagellar biosynthetic protein FliR [Ancrocorticia sp.]|nr:flagellar biosynthetic protein FliR [Ancrocorticia sp.]MCI2178333.1 flagellar biosynthetic protein FliR [Ancrocorticia sp.]MCI2193139.1 flagellar biosynthetic protein FliR [Ancrocorticia sp.]MCI2198861.1 flagellar biosynthetic protein FliR [Ancrocorticia sp.]
MAALEPFMIALVRILAFLLVAPPFSYRAIPMTVRGILAIALAWVLAPTTGYVLADNDGELITRLVVGGATGAGLGALVLITLAAVQAAGRLIDLQGGFEMGVNFDPLSMSQGSAFGRLYELTAIVILFVSQGYQLVIMGLSRSFRAIPLSECVNFAHLGAQLPDVLSQMMVAAVQISGPLIAVLFVTDVGMGLLTRVAPALNAFVLGFPLKILVTLVLSATAVAALPMAVDGLADAAMRLLSRMVG